MTHSYILQSLICSLEIKRAARENSPNLKDLLASISGQDILPSCFKEALWEASSCGHVDAICSLVVAGGKMPLYLKDCIIQALRLDFCEAAATLLMCYAAKHDKRLLLKYLMGGETSREEGEQAILELPCPSVSRNTMAGIRYRIFFILWNWRHFSSYSVYHCGDWLFSLVSFVCDVSVLIYRIFHEKFARTAFTLDLLHVAEIPFWILEGPIAVRFVWRAQLQPSIYQ